MVVYSLKKEPVNYVEVDAYAIVTYMCINVPRSSILFIISRLAESTDCPCLLVIKLSISILALSRKEAFNFYFDS